MLILNSKYQIIIQISDLSLSLSHPTPKGVSCQRVRVCADSIRVGLTSYDYDYDYEYEWQYECEYECECDFDCEWVFECAVRFHIQI